MAGSLFGEYVYAQQDRRKTACAIKNDATNRAAANNDERAHQWK